MIFKKYFACVWKANMELRMLQRIALISVLGFCLQACAFGTRHAVLQYPPPTDSTLNAVSAHLLPLSATVGPFLDRRPEQVVGHVRNGLGMKTADVVGVGDIPSWAKKALETELRSAGVSIIAPGGATKAVHLIITGQVVKAYCSMYMNYEAEVLLNILVNDRSGKELLSRTYTGTGSAGMVFSASAESFATSLSLALQQAIRAFVADFLNLQVSRYAQH